MNSLDYYSLSVLVLTVYYILVAAKLLKDVRAARKKVGTLNMTQSLGPGPSSVSCNTVGTAAVKTAKAYVVNHHSVYCVLVAAVASLCRSVRLGRFDGFICD